MTGIISNEQELETKEKEININEEQELETEESVFTIRKEKEPKAEKKVISINILHKRMVSRHKYLGYKNTLRDFLGKNCFKREENIATYENFHNNYTEELDMILPEVIDKLRDAGDDVYKELLLEKSFEGAVCTFMLSKKVDDFKKPGNLELICDGESILKKDFKNVSRAIHNIMRIKSSEVLFNGNATIVNNNLAIANSQVAYFVVTF